MPYIPREDRADIDSYRLPPYGTGSLTYAVTKVVVDYLPWHPRFEDFAQAIAALECAKLELYRRMIAPYEDTKCAANGDVYPL